MRVGCGDVSPEYHFAYPGYARLLRVRRERPRHHGTADKGDELAPFPVVPPPTIYLQVSEREFVDDGMGEMMKMVFSIAAVVLSLSAFAFADESGLLDKNAGIITKPSNFSVSETMDRVEAAAKGVGASIFARIDYQQTSKKVNVDIRPNQLLIFGRGAGGPYIIKEAPLAGIDVPFKALVWEDSQGKVWVSHTNGSFIDKRYAVKGAASYVKNIDETIEKIMNEALK